jgi:diguanylate cyclase (GGDEF)-like protein
MPGFDANRFFDAGVARKGRGAMSAFAAFPIVEALAIALAAREAGGQVRLHRARVYAAGIARALNLGSAEVEAIDLGVLLHDVGKLVVPDDLLTKADPLAAEEIEKIRTHPLAAAEILAGASLPLPTLDALVSHHERWDGTGYPKGLRGEDIPLAGRIVAAAETLADLDAVGEEQTPGRLDRLQLEAGRSLDPDLVGVLVRIFPAAASELEERGEAATLGLQAKAIHDIQVAHMEVAARHQISRAMSRSLALPDTLELLSGTLGTLVPHRSCAIFVAGEEPGTLVCRVANGLDADRIERLVMHDGEWSARTGTRAASRLQPRPADAESNAGEDHVRTQLASALMYPLIFDDRFVGLLAVYHTIAGAYTREHERLLGRVSEQAASIIHHSLVFEQTREDSFRDPLTALPNARYLYVHLERELARARRSNTQVSLMVLDLDAFKEINDTHGHQAGDAALRAVATALLGVIRPYDVCIRYAGDEFIVVLPNCGSDEGERKRLDLQKAVDDVRFEIPGRHQLRLAISVGVAVFPEDGTTWEVLLAAADRSMYRDKTSRKGHTVHAERR